MNRYAREITRGAVAKLRYESGTGPGLEAYRPVTPGFFTGWAEMGREMYKDQKLPLPLIIRPANDTVATVAAKRGA